jgi:hypothetical protein
VLAPALAREKFGLRTAQQRDPNVLEEKKMKKICASLLLTLIGALGLGLAAQAQTQTRTETVVTLPFEFVASDKTLPAGRYTLRPVSDDPADGLILNNFEHHASVIVHPIETEKTPSAKSNVGFQRVGDQLFLDRIQTSDTVYNLPLSPAAVLLAATPSPKGSAVSGTSGSN